MENEWNSVEKRNKEEIAKSHIVLQCAKAAFLLSTLRHHCTNSTPSTPTAADEEPRHLYIDGEEIWELKKELMKEKLKNKNIQICSLAKFVLQIAILLSLWTFCLLIAFGFLF